MRIALGLEYNGQGYYGWQEQQDLPTIQGCLREALSQIANHPVHIFCAGRTDAGVHSTGQVIHFDTLTERQDHVWVTGTNALLPSSVAVKWMKQVGDDFHARFSAIYRRYRYIIYNYPIRSAHLGGRTTWHRTELDDSLMHLAAQHLLGEQDFSSFRSSQCESLTAMRNIHEINILRKNHMVILEIQANAFLHHMVRNIVGTLIKIGEKEYSPDWIKEILAAKNRCLAPEMAPAEGLYLVKVGYPTEFGFPEPENGVICY